MTIHLQSMLERWFSLFPNGRQELVLQYFCEVQELYRERHRRYHTIEHIERMLRAQEHFFPEASRAVKMAVWLHDMVYDPRCDDNEIRSADAARLLVYELGASKEEAEAVYRLILVTKDHVGSASDELELCDLDLLSLGDPSSAYRITTTQIRQEYAFVSDDLWRVGRRAFVNGFLDRLRIYQTLPMFERYESKARDNLHAERERLSA